MVEREKETGKEEEMKEGHMIDIQGNTTTCTGQKIIQAKQTKEDTNPLKKNTILLK